MNPGMRYGASGWKREEIVMYRNTYSGVLLASAIALLVESALAQPLYSQPWRLHRASHSSIVESCTTPTPMDLAALDDFEVDEAGTILRVRWWGVLLVPGQRFNRPYYIAFYSDNGNCQPLNLLYEECVTPEVIRVGNDCNADPVFRLSAAIPPFAVSSNTRYWLQISEDDSGSARSGVEDFRWSGRRPQRYCPAIQRDSTGTIYTPLLDVCDNQPDDLSFALGGTYAGGHIELPDDLFGPAVFSVQIFDPESNALLESHVVDVYQSGFWEVWPEVAGGSFLLEFRGMGAKPLRAVVPLEEGQQTTLNFLDVHLGDLNGDDTIGLPDLAILLSNYGM
jgi:hypothetical protein